MRKTANGRTDISIDAMRLLDSPLLTVPAFREMVVRELENGVRAGLFHIKADGQVDIEVDAGWKTGTGIPAEEQSTYLARQSGEFRLSDLIGSFLREKQKDGLRHSRVELYWPIAKRDRALAQTLHRLHAGTLEYEESHPFEDF